MKRRTFISLMGVLTASGALSLAGCSNSSASSTAASASDQPADQLDAIRQRGTLIVALEGAWQPWSYHDESDTLVGYDTEVSRAIAQKLGVEPGVCRKRLGQPVCWHGCRPVRPGVQRC